MLKAVKFSSLKKGQRFYFTKEGQYPGFFRNYRMLQGIEGVRFFKRERVYFYYDCTTRQVEYELRNSTVYVQA